MVLAVVEMEQELQAELDQQEQLILAAVVVQVLLVQLQQVIMVAQV